jgi:hypothetical protein
MFLATVPFSFVNGKTAVGDNRVNTLILLGRRFPSGNRGRRGEASGRGMVSRPQRKRQQQRAISPFFRWGLYGAREPENDLEGGHHPLPAAQRKPTARNVRRPVLLKAFSGRLRGGDARR